MDSQAMSVLISVGALIVSILSGIAAYRVQRAQTRVQERPLALETVRERGRLRETRRAKITGRVVRSETDHGTDYRLVITNEGLGSARLVRVHLDGRPLSAHPMTAGQGEVSELGPGANADYLLMVTMGSPDVITVAVEWDDDSGEPGMWRSQFRL